MLMVFRKLVILLLIFICGCGVEPKYVVTNYPLPSNEIIFMRYKFGTFHKPEIWAMDRDGKNQVKLGEMSPFIGGISWTLDGKKMAYRYNPRGKICEIWIAEFKNDKIRHRKILRSDNPIYAISWAPDGKKIVFEMENSKDEGIYVIDSNGKNLKKLTNYTDWVSFPLWSPDGKKIAFNRRGKDAKWKIYIMNADGTNVERLTNNPPFIEETVRAWSSDGKWIVFQEKNPNKKIEERKYIVLINLETKERYKLTPFPKYISSMCFSPDGKKLAFEADDFKNKTDKSSQTEIYTIDIDGKNLKNLTNTPDWDESCLSWRPIPKDKD